MKLKKNNIYQSGEFTLSTAGQFQQPPADPIPDNEMKGRFIQWDLF